MADIIPQSVTSIKIVSSELNATLQSASRHFEAYMTDRNAAEQLNECRTVLAEITGVLKMLNIPGALLLVQEMLALTDLLIKEPARANDFSLSALSHAFVAMPCYLEYVLDKEQAIPALTLVFVNELRAARRESIVLESELTQYALTGAIDLAGSGDAQVDKALIVRLRQMYQVGLIGLIREDNTQLKLQLMHRAMQRLANASGQWQVRGQWLIATAVLEALLSGDLALNFTRKRTLSMVDALLRQFEQTISSELSDNNKLLTELVYLVNLSRCTHSAASEVAQRLSLIPLTVSDKQLQQERHVMQGPNAETISMMVVALKEELAHCKEQLEVAAQDMEGSVDFVQIANVFHRTSDIFSVIGLNSPSQVLRNMNEIVRSWVEDGAFDKEQLPIVADNLLYVESALHKLSRFDLNFEDQQSDEEAKRALMARSQLDEATQIVIQEAQVGIAEAKKEINSFMESNFDRSHLEVALEALLSVRGGLTVLGYKRAAAVLASSVKFIQANLDSASDEQTAMAILETMADALISLEYYLSEIELHGHAADNILQIAEQSLAALGFSVSL